jgi:hypothetical protein
MKLPSPTPPSRIITALRQESTWRGIIAISMALGITLDPALQNHIVAVGLALIGAINVGKSD